MFYSAIKWFIVFGPPNPFDESRLRHSVVYGFCRFASTYAARFAGVCDSHTGWVLAILPRGAFAIRAILRILRHLPRKHPRRRRPPSKRAFYHFNHINIYKNYEFVVSYTRIVHVQLEYFALRSLTHTHALHIYNKYIYVYRRLQRKI